MENKYILGEKALGKLFIGNKITFSKVFFILTMIMFINILMIINKPIDIIIIINIFISFSILSWMTYRIMRLFLQANNIKKDLFVKYYYENKKMLDRSVPTKKYDSVMLDNLHDRCIYLIENNEIEYKEIQPIYLDIIDKALFNNKQLLQEYFIEPNIHDDILTKYLHMVKTLIDNNKVNIAIYYYISLLLRLNYYNAYIPNYNLFDTYYIINRFIYRCDDVTELEELVRNQLMIEELVLEQVYLCNKSDFSFMRLAKLRMIIKNKISSDLFASIYESIFNNKNIEKNDKNKLYRQLYDSFRMVSFNLVHKFHDITTFKPKKSIPPNRDVDIEIVAMPIARLLLSTINNNDKENLNLFIKMNIDNKQMILAKNLTLLYITLSDMYNKTEYSFYKGIYTDKAIEIINKNKNFFSGFDDYEILNSVYANIKEISKESSEDNNFYSDDYIFSFKESYIDTYFYALFKVLKIKITNKDLNVDKNYEDKLIKIISKMINAN
ncbi:hypothetical protein QJS64_04970 [Paraclostridium bifermentans]|uniref:Integral membrane protein n=1 Tax=Paraclostridium bifermentans TaxID=1490 RepID=A0ABY8R4N5_PARBF|nr:hypothetical protein QJS64_04970 [Paraclostridium bifermentans]